MKGRSVSLLPEAESDLTVLYERVSDAAGERIAFRYIESIKKFCAKLDLASERGHRRDDVRQGMRIVGFRGRVTIAFFVDGDRVLVSRIFYGGQNWEAELSDE